MSDDFSDSESASASAATRAADAVVKKALQGAQEGISSYTHGSRSVSRTSPQSGLDFADRYEERARRKAGRMPFMRCEFGGAASSATRGGGGVVTAGVSSVNGISGAVEIAAGKNVEIVKAANALVISAEGGTTGGVESINGKQGAFSIVAGTGIDIRDFSTGILISGAETPQTTARIVDTATATVLATDDLILMDTATAGQAQTLTLPASLEADAATVTVRQLGDYGVTIAHGANEYHLTYAGDWVTLDWISGKGWFWRA